MPTFNSYLAGGRAVSGGALAPRSRRGNTDQIVDYWAGGTITDGDFQSISTVTVGATANLTVTFSSIPTTYKHLQIRAIALSGSDGVPVLLRFNSDSGANYSQHYLAGQGAIIASGAGTSTSAVTLTGIYARGLNPSYAWAYVIDILDYGDTNKYTTVRALHGADYNGSGEINLTSGNWQNTSAVSTITLSMASSGFNQYSSFALYGIKG